MSKAVHVRKKHSDIWLYGPKISANDLEMLLNTFGKDGYNCYANDDIEEYYYDVSANDVKRIIDALSSMSDSQYQENLSFDDSDLLYLREYLISEFQFIYNNRDPDWGEGNWMLLGWY